MLGNASDMRPRCVRAPAAQCSASVRPPVPVMFSRVSEPVAASKPVASTSNIGVDGHPACQAHPGGRHGGDRVGLGVDEVHVVAVEGVVVAGLQHSRLVSGGWSWGSTGRRSPDPLIMPRTLRSRKSRNVVGLLVEDQVGEAGVQREPAGLPPELVLGLALLRVT